MKIVATIEARMRSSRLPGKVLEPVLGRPLLELMIERLRRARHVDEIVIATTDDPSCQPIEDLARRLGVACFRGSENDVLDRVLCAAKSVHADLIVETTGDCPLIDPATVDRVIETFLASNVDYCANVLERTYPRGMDVQVFLVAVLDAVARLTDDPADREHVSLFIYQHPERFRLRNVAFERPEAADLRLTVDTPEDFALVRRVFEALYPDKPDFDLGDILNLFDARPELGRINADIRQKAVH